MGIITKILQLTRLVISSIASFKPIYERHRRFLGFSSGTSIFWGIWAGIQKHMERGEIVDQKCYVDALLLPRSGGGKGTKTFFKIGHFSINLGAFLLRLVPPSIKAMEGRANCTVRNRLKHLLHTHTA